MRLKRLCYSEIVLEEKDFGIQEMALRAKRKGQVAIGKTRKNISDKISRSAYNDYNKYLDTENIIKNYENNNSLINNKQVSKELFKDIRRDGGRVFLGDQGSAGFVGLNKENLIKVKQGIQSGLSDVNLDNTQKTYFNKLNNHLKSNNQFIMVNPNDSIGTLAHEVGHQQRFNSKNPVISYVSHNNPKGRERLQGNFGYKVNKEKGTVVADSSKYSPFRAMLDHAMVITEERGATNSGLKKLKNLGVDQNTLNLQKQELKIAGDTYKYANRSRVKSLLADKIQIPSRRQAILKKQEMDKKALKALSFKKGTPSSFKKPIITPGIKTTPTIATPKKPFGTKPITPTQKPLQSTPPITGNVKY